MAADHRTDTAGTGRNETLTKLDCSRRTPGLSARAGAVVVSGPVPGIVDRPAGVKCGAPAVGRALRLARGSQRPHGVGLGDQVALAPCQ